MADKTKGWVHLWRCFFDDPLWKEPRRYSRAEAFIDILGNLASGKDRDRFRRGEFTASLNFLARRWRWPIGTVRRFLTYLEKRGTIQKMAAQGSAYPCAHFIICKYDTYNNVAHTPAHTHAHQVKKEDIKKEYKETNNNLFEKFWPAYPVHESRAEAERIWKRLQLTSEDVAVILEALEKHKASDRWKRGFAPTPANWLRGRKWEDETVTAYGSSNGNGAREQTIEERTAELDRLYGSEEDGRKQFSLKNRRRLG